MANKDFSKAIGNLTGGLQNSKLGDASRPFGSVAGAEPDKKGVEQQLDGVNVPVQEIEISKLRDNPFQYLARPATDDEADPEGANGEALALDELTTSIQRNGFYGSLLARPAKGHAPGTYQLAFGHRRTQAAKRAGLTHLPVKVVDLTDIEMARIMASENFARQDLKPIGEANVIGLLAQEQNLSINEISEIVGKGRGWVEMRMSLFEAPPDLKEMVERKPDALSYVRILRQVWDEDFRGILIQNVLNGQYNRDVVLNRVQSWKQRKAEENEAKIRLEHHQREQERLAAEKANAAQTPELALDEVAAATSQQIAVSGWPEAANQSVESGALDAYVAEQGRIAEQHQQAITARPEIVTPVTSVERADGSENLHIYREPIDAPRSGQGLVSYPGLNRFPLSVVPNTPLVPEPDEDDEQPTIGPAIFSYGRLVSKAEWNQASDNLSAAMDSMDKLIKEARGIPMGVRNELVLAFKRIERQLKAEILD